MKNPVQWVVSLGMVQPAGRPTSTEKETVVHSLEIILKKDTPHNVQCGVCAVFAALVRVCDGRNGKRKKVKYDLHIWCALLV